jgi:hypothetical protein
MPAAIRDRDLVGPRARDLARLPDTRARAGSRIMRELEAILPQNFTSRRAYNRLVQRRSFVKLATVTLPLLAWRRGLTASGVPELWNGEQLDRPIPGAITASHPRGGDVPVRLTARVIPRAIHAFSIRNDNSMIELWITFSHQPGNPCQYLGLDGTWWMAAAYSYGDSESSAEFDVDRASAERLARAFQIALHLRARLDTGMRYEWTFPSTATTVKTDPITIRLRAINAGTTPVRFGRTGPASRDFRFQFDITRDGMPVSQLSAADFSSSMPYLSLAPGQHMDCSCDLRAWAPLEQPGSYRIAASYHGSLCVDGDVPPGPMDHSRYWDIQPTGQGTIVVA